MAAIAKQNTDTNRICQELQTAIDARHGLKPRWEQNERVYRNEPGIAAVRLYDNFEPRTVPVLSPRINRIVNVTIAALTAPSVWVQAIAASGRPSSAARIAATCSGRSGPGSMTTSSS